MTLYCISFMFKDIEHLFMAFFIYFSGNWLLIFLSMFLLHYVSVSYFTEEYTLYYDINTILCVTYGKYFLGQKNYGFTPQNHYLKKNRRNKREVLWTKEKFVFSAKLKSENGNQMIVMTTKQSTIIVTAKARTIIETLFFTMLVNMYKFLIATYLSRQRVLIFNRIHYEMDT